MTQSKPSGVSELHDWIIEAGETERRLPAAVKKYRGSYWPEMLPEWLSYASEATVVGLDPATAEQVTRFDILASQILNMHVDERRLLWAVAHAGAFRSRGVNWVRVGKYLHCERRTAKRRYESALISLWYSWI